MSMSPVENTPSRKYFREASLLFKFRLSAPVRIYNGIEMISTPRKRISNDLNELTRMMPHMIKNISAKYSA